MTPQGVMPDCRLMPEKVCEMDVGDVGYAAVTALLVDMAGKAFIRAHAAIIASARPISNTIRVLRDAQGFNLDISGVPGYRWKRGRIFYKVYRARLTGAICPS